MIYFKNPHGDDYYQNYVQYFQEVHAEVMKKYRWSLWDWMLTKRHDLKIIMGEDHTLWNFEGVVFLFTLRRHKKNAL